MQSINMWEYAARGRHLSCVSFKLPFSCRLQVTWLGANLGYAGDRSNKGSRTAACYIYMYVRPRYEEYARGWDQPLHSKYGVHLQGCHEWQQWAQQMPLRTPPTLTARFSSYFERIERENPIASPALLPSSGIPLSPDSVSQRLDD